MKKIFSLLLVICMLFCITACEEKNESENTTENTNEIGTVSKETDTSTDDIFETDEPIEQDDTPSTNSIGIKGSNYVDVTLNMENRGFPEKETILRESTTLYMSNCWSANNSQLFYEVEKARDGSIVYASFTIMKGSNDFKKDYQYLEFASTIPYDGYEPEKAQQWVRDNIDTLTKNGMTVSTTIGAARFDLYGNKDMKILELHPAE